MICASLSDQFLRFGQMIREDNNYSVKFVDKKALSFLFEPSQLGQASLTGKLEALFGLIRESLIVPDSELLLSVSDEWMDILFQNVDVGLDRTEVLEVLNWTLRTRYGDLYKDRIIQHYNLVSDLTIESTVYVTISLFKKFAEIMHKAARSSGFRISLLDINLFSAMNCIEKLYPVTNYKTWGVWQVGKQKHSLVLVDSGEFRAYAEFEIVDNAEFVISRRSSPDDIIEKVVEELNQAQYSSATQLESLDYLYYYSHEVDSDFFNIVLMNELENMKPATPFLTHTPLKLYLDDGDGDGAMCQFMDVMGLMLRRMSGSAK